MINSDLLCKLLKSKNILFSLKPNEKFKFENDSDEYYFISNYIVYYMMWNDTKKQVRKIPNHIYENANIKIKKL